MLRCNSMPRKERGERLTEKAIFSSQSDCGSVDRMLGRKLSRRDLEAMSKMMLKLALSASSSFSAAENNEFKELL